MSVTDSSDTRNRRSILPTGAREAMERLNEKAAPFSIWLRTQANAPAQKPWFKNIDLGEQGNLASGWVGAGQQKVQPYHWAWSDIFPFLLQIAQVVKDSEVSPTEFADRQQFLLINPVLGGRLQVTTTIRCAVSIYNPGDVAPVHMHTPNASRLILSEMGGYTTVDGERCQAERGDLILTPHGTWHDHGNDADEPVMWMDVLDWPLLETLDCIWLDDEFPGEISSQTRVQVPSRPTGYSNSLYGTGGLMPSSVDHQRGIAKGTSPMIHFRGRAVRETLEQLLRVADPDPYEATSLRFVNPLTGTSVFPTLDYEAQLIPAGTETGWKRETCSRVYTVLEGSGSTSVGNEEFHWTKNDIFVVPCFTWRRHINTASGDAVLYSVSDLPLLEKIGQYRAQGKKSDGTTCQLIT